MKLIFVLLVISPLIDAKVYERTFSLRPDQKPSADGRVKSLLLILYIFSLCFLETLKKPTKLRAVPTIPDILTLAPKKVIVDPQNADFDPCKTINLCQNNGTCVKEGSSFYCECLSEYYGKTCEFHASQVNCVNHKCRNNGTCYRFDCFYFLHFKP